MSSANIGAWVRAGVWALPVYGLLTFWATLTHEPNRQTEVEAYARYISTSSYLTQHILGSILAIFGVIALATYLANGRAGRLALVAMVMGVAGNCLVLTIFGFSTIVSPVIGESYLAGQQDAMKVNEAIIGSTAFVLLAVPGLLLYLVGAILFGVAIWRSGALPRWAGVLYAPTGFLIAGVAIGGPNPRKRFVGGRRDMDSMERDARSFEPAGSPAKGTVIPPRELHATLIPVDLPRLPMTHPGFIGALYAGRIAL